MHYFILFLHECLCQIWRSGQVSCSTPLCLEKWFTKFKYDYEFLSGHVIMSRDVADKVRSRPSRLQMGHVWFWKKEYFQVARGFSDFTSVNQSQSLKQAEASKTLSLWSHDRDSPWSLSYHLSEQMVNSVSSEHSKNLIINCFYFKGAAGGNTGRTGKCYYWCLHTHTRTKRFSVVTDDLSVWSFHILLMDFLWFSST